MERTQVIRRMLIVSLVLGLVFALAACGSTLDPAGLLEDEQELETIVDVPGEDESGLPGDEDPAGEPPPPGDGATSYDQPPTIDGEPVTEDDLADGIPDGAVLEGDFSGWDFSGLDFKYASLNGAMFDGAKFVGTRFSGSTLHGGSFVGADFTAAQLMGADLSYGIFHDAIFTNAGMPGGSFKRYLAQFDGATWTDGETTCAEPSVGNCVH